MNRKKRKNNFLLLELLIALFLVGLCALPLVRLPMQTLQEETSSAWRIEMQRYADLAFAEVKKDLLNHQIDWDTFACPSKEKAKILNNTLTVEIPPLGKRSFQQTGYLWSVGKKDKQGKEVRLVTFQVEFQSKDKLFRAHGKKRNFVSYKYQLIAEQVPKNLPEQK